VSKWVRDIDEHRSMQTNLAAALDTSERTILVVDDDTAIRDALSDVLKMLGYQVVVASDGKRALELLRSGIDPFVVLLDLAMPGMDGYQFCEEVLTDGRLSGLQVIVITAAPSHRAKSLGVAEILTKPVPLERLLNVLESVERGV